MSPLPVGLLSSAHPHATAYAEALETLDAATLVGVATDDGVSVPQAPVMPEEELLDAVSAVIVCSTNADHRPLVERAAAAGVDVLCEKPLGTSVPDAMAIVNACESAGVRLGVAMPLRFSEPARQARRALERGDLGELKMVVGTNLLQLPRADWFFDPDEAGGGAIMDHTAHIVDLVRWVTGQEVRQVYAETGTRFHDGDVEDVDVLSMALADGTPFSHDGSWSRPDKWDFWGDATLRLVGTAGIVEVDCFDQTVTVTRDEGDRAGIQSVYWGSDVNEGLIADFVEAVRTDRPPAATGRDGARDVAVIETAYESAERGVPVSVQYPPAI